MKKTNANKKAMKKRILFFTVILTVFILTSAILIIRGAYSTTINFDVTNDKVDQDVEISFGGTTTSSNINFNVKLLNNGTQAVQTTFTFTPTSMNEDLLTKYVYLELFKSTDGITFLPFDIITITKDDLGKDLVYKTVDYNSNALTYYKVELYVGGAKQSIIMNNLYGTFKVDAKRIDIPYQEETFDYTGNYQTFTAPDDGTYKIEAWGAQGGGANTTIYSGGSGAYTTGHLDLNAGDNLFIYVGGAGTGGLTNQTYAGGYNGGRKYSNC